MASIIEMPKLSDTMSVGTVVKWHKSIGDEVSNGDVLAEIETDKATMELENFDDGFLLQIFVDEGNEAPIGSPLAAVGQKGEDIPDPSDGASSNLEPSIKTNEEDSSTDPYNSPKDAQSDSSIDAFVDQPSAEPSQTTEVASERIFASPLARKMAKDRDIDLSKVKGSGPNGRIVKKDLTTGLETNLARSISKEKKDSIKAHSPSLLKSIEEKKVSVSKMRSVIAKRLLESKNTIPHFYLQKEINATPLLLARKRMNLRLSERSDEYSKISVNDLILFACADAIKFYPAINSSWGENEIHFHGNVNLSFGVAVEDGLVTPVIRNAEKLSLTALSKEAKSLIEKARAMKLTPDEMSGSTFTVTNLGMFGIDFFSGIINPPNSAILSIGASVRKPIIDDEGNLSIGETIMLGLSCDHRLVDGAVGAGFLKLLAENLESPAALLV